MGIEQDIARLLKAEGYRINETVNDAIDELMDVCEDVASEDEALLDEDEDEDDD